MSYALDFQNLLLWLQARLGRHLVVSLCLGSSHVPAASMAGYLAAAEDLDRGRLTGEGDLAESVAFRLTRDPGDPAGDANGRFLLVADGFREARWIPYGQDYMAITLDGYRLEIRGDLDLDP